LVVLAGVAVSGQPDFAAVGQTTFFVGVFVVVVFVVGKLVAPPALRVLDLFDFFFKVDTDVRILRMLPSSPAAMLHARRAYFAFTSEKTNGKRCGSQD